VNHELGEAWLAKRLLDQTGIDVFTGTTDRDIRRERIRAAILDHRLANIVLGKGPSGKPEDYATILQRLYAQPLTELKTVQG
jgi:hypothetical protein